MTSTANQFTSVVGQTAAGTALIGGGVVTFLSDNQLVIGISISCSTLLILFLSKSFDAWMKWRKDKRDQEESAKRMEFLEREKKDST